MLAQSNATPAAMTKDDAAGRLDLHEPHGRLHDHPPETDRRHRANVVGRDQPSLSFNLTVRIRQLTQCATECSLLPSL